jgi:hypothetical protein
MILFAAVLLAAAGCVPPGPYYMDDEEAGPTVFEDVAEAEQIALYIEDDVLMNRFTFKRVFYDMTLIRGAFGREIEAVSSIRFRPPCKDGRVTVVFDKETFPTVLDGGYEHWTELNDRYLPYDVKTVKSLRKVYLYFDGLIDYRALAAKYAELPNVESAACVMHIGDGPNVYARRTDTGIDYLFRDAWERCSTGCEKNVFYYFVCENDDAVYVGYWDPDERKLPPGWWVMARKCLPEEIRDQF